MADFNAGSIIGSLDIDRSPFTQGLDEAKRQAAEFEGRKVEPRADLDTTQFKADITRVQDKLDALSKEEPTISVQVEQAHLNSELAELQAKLDKATRDRTITIRERTINEGGGGLPGGLPGDRGSGGGIPGDRKKSGDSSGGFDLAAKAMTALKVSAVALAPALIPMLASAGASAVALAGGLTTAGVGLGAFALVAKGDFTNMQQGMAMVAKAQNEMINAKTSAQQAKAIADLAAAQKHLTGNTGLAAAAFTRMKSAFSDLQTKTSQPVYGVMMQAFNLAAKVLPMLEPVIKATASALGGAIGQLSAGFSSAGFKQFMAFVGQNIGPIINSLVSSLINFGAGLASLFQAVNPLTLGLFHNINNISVAFKNWADRMKAGGIQPFLDYLAQNVPLVSGVLLSLWHALVNIGKGLMPMTGPALGILKSVFDALSKLNLTSLGTSIGKVMTAITPLIPALGNGLGGGISLLATLLPVVAPLLTTLSNALLALSKNPAGAKLLGVVAALVAFHTATNKVTDKFPGLIKGFQDTAKQASKFMAGLKGKEVEGFAGKLGALASKLPSVSKVMEGVKIAGNAAKGGLLAMGEAIGPLLIEFAPFILVAAGLAALAFVIYKNWGPISRFFERIWKDVSGFFMKHIKIIEDWVTGGILPLVELIVGHWSAITGFFSRIWNDVVGFFSKHIQLILWFIAPLIMLPVTIFTHWNQIIGWLRGVWNTVWSDIQNVWGSIMGYLGGIPNAIGGFFSGAIHWLENVGHDIITGLWNGMKQEWGTVTGWLKHLNPASWFNDINPYQGHAEVNLLPVGKMVFQGLHAGMVEEWGKTQKWLASIDPSASISATSRINPTAGSLNDLAQRQATNTLAASIDALRKDVRALPVQTGNAVGSKVGNIHNAMEKQTRDIVTATRQG